MSKGEGYRVYLKELLSLRSVSTDPIFKQEIGKTVDYLKRIFEEDEFAVNIFNGYGNPIVLASYHVSDEIPTCLIYGHYDVQPAEQSDGWVGDPFELQERDGRIYGRGVVDNKGQFLVHVATIIELIKEKKLSCNVKIMLEGNEETGSEGMVEFVNKESDKLDADFVLVSDGEMNMDFPEIDAGFRGGFNSTLTITSGKTDLHSGLFGGVVPNSAHEMAIFLGRLFDDSGNVNLPGFYNDVEPILETRGDNGRLFVYDREHFRLLAGVKELTGNKNYDLHSLIGLRPTIQVTGFQSGYVGDGYRNSVPSKCVAKLNFRLVKNQVPSKIIERYRSFVQEMLPSCVDFNLDISEAFEGMRLDLDNPFVRRTEKIIKHVYGSEPVYKFSGGGLPIATLFDSILHIPIVLLPLCNEDCAMHAPNENYDLKYLDKSLSFSREFFSFPW